MARDDGILLEHIALDGGDPESGQPTRQVEVANAQHAVDDPAVIAYVGPWTSEATGWSLPITSKAGLLHFGVTATWPGLTQEGWDPGEPGKYYQGAERNYIRLVPPDTIQARRAARWMRFIGVTQAVAIDDGSSYGQGLARAFLEEWRSLQPDSDSRTISLPLYLRTEMAPGARSRRAFFFAASNIENAFILSKSVAEKEPDALIFFTDTAMHPGFAEALGTSHNTWNRFVTLNTGSIGQTGELARLYAAHYKEELSPPAARAVLGVDILLEAVSERGSLRVDAIDWSRHAVLREVRRFAHAIVITAPIENRPTTPPNDPSGRYQDIFDADATLDGFVVIHGEFRFVRRLTPTRP